MERLQWTLQPGFRDAARRLSPSAFRPTLRRPARARTRHLRTKATRPACIGTRRISAPTAGPSTGAAARPARHASSTSPPPAIQILKALKERGGMPAPGLKFSTACTTPVSGFGRARLGSDGSLAARTAAFSRPAHGIRLSVLRSRGAWERRRPSAQSPGDGISLACGRARLQSGVSCWNNARGHWTDGRRWWSNHRAKVDGSWRHDGRAKAHPRHRKSRSAGPRYISPGGMALFSNDGWSRCKSISHAIARREQKASKADLLKPSSVGP